MKGRSQDFQFEGQTFALHRASFSEMHGIVERIDEGEVERLLLEAAGEKGEELNALLGSADHEKVIELWGSWLEFAGVDAYRKKFVEPRQVKALQDQAVMFRAMKDQGLVSETFLQEMMNNALDDLPSLRTTPSDSSTIN